MRTSFFADLVLKQGLPYVVDLGHVFWQGEHLQARRESEGETNSDGEHRPAQASQQMRMLSRARIKTGLLLLTFSKISLKSFSTLIPWLLLQKMSGAPPMALAYLRAVAQICSCSSFGIE